MHPCHTPQLTLNNTVCNLLFRTQEVTEELINIVKHNLCHHGHKLDLYVKSKAFRKSMNANNVTMFIFFFY